MLKTKHWLARAALGATLIALLPLASPTTASAVTPSAPSPAIDAPPSATPAAGPERARAAALANGRPKSGATPSAGPTFTQTGGVWQANRSTVTLRNTVTDPDGDKANLTFEVWTVDASNKPKTKVKLDSSQFGVLVSPMVDSGKNAQVTVGYGRLNPGWTYTFRTSAYDGALYETEWSPWALFKVRDRAVDITLPEPDANAPDVDLAAFQEHQVGTRNMPEPPAPLTARSKNALPAPIGEGCTDAGNGKIGCLVAGKPDEFTQAERSAVAQKMSAASPDNLFDWCDNLNTGKDYLKRTEACLKKATPLHSYTYSKLPNGQTILVGEATFASQIQVKLDPQSTTFQQKWWMVPVSFKDFAGKQSEWGPLTVTPEFTCAPQCTTSAPEWSAAPTWSTTEADMHTAVATFTHTSSETDLFDVGLAQLSWKWEARTPSTTKDWEGDLGTSTPDFDIRCDKVASTTPGCVFSEYKPTWVMNFKKFPAAVAHAWLVQTKLSPHPGSKTADKPMKFLPANGGNSGRKPSENREVICPLIPVGDSKRGWAVINGNPDTTLLPNLMPNDTRSCDEFAYASSYNSAGMPTANNGLNPVSSGDQCVQTYATRAKPGEWHFYDEIRQAAPTWKELCGRASMSNWTNTQSMQPFPHTFSRPNRLLDQDEYWVAFPEFAACSPGAATVKCTPKP